MRLLSPNRCVDFWAAHQSSVRRVVLQRNQHQFGVKQYSNPKSHQNLTPSACNYTPLVWSCRKIFYSPVQKLPNLLPNSDPGPIGFSTCGRRGVHGLARVGTTSDNDRQNYFQILCCGRDIVVTILKFKCQKQNVHGEFGSTESLVIFLISAL